MAQDALRAEASLRAQLRSQMKAREAKKSKCKQQGRSRATKRLDNCPGITSPSLSGKRMEPVPVLFVREKKRLASEVKNAKRRRQRLTKRARLLTTEDLLTVVALRESDRAARENTSRTNEASDELVASEHSDNEEGQADAAEANAVASPVLPDAERDQDE